MKSRDCRFPIGRAEGGVFVEVVFYRRKVREDLAQVGQDTRETKDDENDTESPPRRRRCPKDDVVETLAQRVHACEIN